MYPERHTPPGYLHVWPIPIVNLHYRSVHKQAPKSVYRMKQSRTEGCRSGTNALMNLIAEVTSLRQPLLLLLAQ